MHLHRFKKAKIDASPVLRNTRSTCLLLCLPLEVVLRVLRVLRVLHDPLLLPLLLPLELPLVCCVFYRVSFLNNLCL